MVLLFTVQTVRETQRNEESIKNAINHYHGKLKADEKCRMDVHPSTQAQRSDGERNLEEVFRSRIHRLVDSHLPGLLIKMD